jgi:ubiquinone/menaquinone biosynthesis C-methylase UbiE
MHADAAMTVDPAIRDYYERVPEETRLELGSQLERDRTQELILRHAPPAPAVVLDVGGAAGVYAFWLAERGYEVHLIDATPRLIDVARARNEQATARLASCRVGDARALDASGDAASLVLLLGPLYHLVRADDRRAALREALRVLRPGGSLVAAGISRWASTLDGLSRELLRDPVFSHIVERDLADGNHLNPTDHVHYFTTAYFHRPDELKQEVVDAGFDAVQLYGIEGPGWILPDFVDRWSDPKRREILLRVARTLESEPAVIGCSAHLLVVGRKPNR